MGADSEGVKSFSHYPPPLPSPPLPSPPPPFPIIFWFDHGSGFRTAVSLTFRTTKEEAPTPRNHQDSCWKGAAG